MVSRYYVDSYAYTLFSPFVHVRRRFFFSCPFFTRVLFLNFECLRLRPHSRARPSIISESGNQTRRKRLETAITVSAWPAFGWLGDVIKYTSCYLPLPLCVERESDADK